MSTFLSTIYVDLLRRPFTSTLYVDLLSSFLSPINFWSLFVDLFCWPLTISSLFLALSTFNVILYCWPLCRPFIVNSFLIFIFYFILLTFYCRPLIVGLLLSAFDCRSFIIDILFLAFIFSVALSSSIIGLLLLSLNCRSFYYWSWLKLLKIFVLSVFPCRFFNESPSTHNRNLSMFAIISYGFPNFGF